MLPSLMLIFLVLGTIFLGIASPTEAGAMGSMGAILLAIAHRRFTRKMLWQSAEGTMRITTMVIFILIGATVFSLVFQGVNGGKWIEHLLSHIPGGRLGFLIFVNIFVFFLDFFEIVFIIVPLLIPTAIALDIDLVWLGVLLCVNMQTAFMHPPFGFALFYLRGIAPPEIKSRDIYLGSIPWIVLQLVLVALIIAFPEIVDYWIAPGAMLNDADVQQQLDQLQIPSIDMPAINP
jgi:tripartite ATP-independent transporter DctM subunit